METASVKKEYLKQSTKELIKLCKSNKLPHNGTKMDLVNRLTSHYQTKLNKNKNASPKSKKVKKSKNKIVNNSIYYLICGYIRRIESTLKSTKIIPISIYELCLLYYPNYSIIVCLYNNTEGNKQIGVADIEQKTNWKYKIKQLNGQKNKYLKYEWLTNMKYSSGFCLQKNIVLPPQISKVYKARNRNKSVSNVIFKIGGQSKEQFVYESERCNAFIFDSIDSVAYNYNLPMLREPLWKSNVLFDDKLGLLSFGGEMGNVQSTVYRLPWHLGDNDLDLKEWKWEKLPNLGTARAQCTALMIRNENKAMFIGGYGGTRCHRGSGKSIKIIANSTEIYDFKEMKSMEMEICTDSIQRYCGGGYYDENTKRVFIGGGIGGADGKKFVNDVVFYDFGKNIWFDNVIPNTKNNYSKFPILWIDHNATLYIAGNWAMESFDLRNNKKSWRIIYSTKYPNKMKNLFGIDNTNKNLAILLN
eukprot:222045_1